MLSSCLIHPLQERVSQMQASDNLVRMVCNGCSLVFWKKVCVCRGGFSALSLPLQPMADELRAKEAELVALREELREKEEKMDALKTEQDKTRRELAQARIIRGPQQVGG